MRAMILAAGLGQRLRPHTEKCGKPALPFLNLPLICYPFFYLNKLGLSDLVINTHHTAESVRQASKKLGHPQIHFSHESPDLLGSGGGIKHAESLLKGEGNFLVANGDEVLIAPQGLQDFWNNHLNSKAIASLLLCRHLEVGTRFGGVWVDSQDRVKKFGKQPITSSLDGLHYTGFIALSDRVFDYLPQGQASNILYDALTKAIADGELVRGHFKQNTWYETGNEADFLDASNNCLQHLANNDNCGRILKELHHHFGRVLIPVSSGVWIGQNCEIHQSATIDGPALIGNNVKIGPSTHLKGFSVVGDKTLIGEGCILENCILGPLQKVFDEKHLNKIIIDLPLNYSN